MEKKWILWACISNSITTLATQNRHFSVVDRTSLNTDRIWSQKMPQKYLIKNDSILFSFFIHNHLLSLNNQEFNINYIIFHPAIIYPKSFPLFRNISTSAPCKATPLLPSLKPLLLLISRKYPSLRSNRW